MGFASIFISTVENGSIVEVSGKGCPDKTYVFPTKDIDEIRYLVNELTSEVLPAAGLKKTSNQIHTSGLLVPATVANDSYADFNWNCEVVPLPRKRKPAKKAVKKTLTKVTAKKRK